MADITLVIGNYEGAGFLEGCTESRTRFQQRPPHAQLLRSLPRKQKRQLPVAIALRFPHRHRRMRAALAQCAQRFHCLRRIPRRHRGP